MLDPTTPIATTPIVWLAIRSGGRPTGFGTEEGSSGVIDRIRGDGFRHAASRRLPSQRSAQEIVDAERPCSIDRQEQETADNGKVLQAGGDLLLSRRAREAGSAVRQQRGDDGETEQRERTQPRPEAEQDHEPAADLGEDGERQEEARRRQMQRRDLRGTARGIAEFREPAPEKDG